MLSLASCGPTATDSHHVDHVQEKQAPLEITLHWAHQQDRDEYFIPAESITPKHFAEVRKKLAGLLGVGDLFSVPFDERPPLNPIFTGAIQAEDYFVFRLHYESLAGFFVPANLYVPSIATDRFARPAIICPHGHWHDGKASPQVQVRSIGLVKQGFVVLAYDTLGSLERLDSLATLDGHDTPSTLSTYIGGPLSMGVQAYEVSRAVDFLTGLSDVVDATRIGVTASSGGASQILFATALDPRIKASVPVGFESAGTAEPFGCGCETVPFLGGEIGVGLLYTLSLPSATLFLADEHFGVLNCALAKTIADQLENGNLVHAEKIDAPHGYSRPHRERMYAWMRYWLAGKGDAQSTLPDPPGVYDEMPLRSPAELRVELPLSSVTFSEMAVLIRSGNREMNTIALQAQSDSLRKISLKKNFFERMNLSDAKAPISVVVKDDRPLTEIIEINTEDISHELKDQHGRRSLPAGVRVMVKKPSVPPPWAWVVILDQINHQQNDISLSMADKTDPDAALLGMGYAVARVALRHDPILSALAKDHAPRWVENALTRIYNWKGHPLFARHVHDVLVLVDYLQGRSDVLDNRITLWAMKSRGLVVVVAGSLTDEVCQVVTQNSPLTFEGTIGVTRPTWSFPPKILDLSDVDGFASVIFPGSLVLIDPIDEGGNPASIGTAQRLMPLTFQRYHQGRSSDRFRIVEGRTDSNDLSFLNPACFAP